MRFRCAIAHTREESDCASERGVRRRSGAGAGKEIREKHGLTRLTIRMVTGSVVRIDDSLLNDYGGGRM